jgi:hypothetical protein
MNLYENDALFETAAIASTPGWIVPIVIGVALVALLTGIVWWDTRRKRERAPRPDEQPRRPDHRTEISQVREADDFGTSRERLRPHELKTYGTHAAPPGTPPHDDTRSGGFGSGAFGG